MGKYDEGQQVGGRKVYRPWGHWTKGDSLAGKYLGITEDKYGKDNYDIEVEEVEFDEEEVSYVGKKSKKEVVCRTPKIGEVFSLGPAGALAKAFNQIDVGDCVKVIYMGTSTIKGGEYDGTESHGFKVIRVPKDKFKATKEAPAKESVGGDNDVL